MGKKAAPKQKMQTPSSNKTLSKAGVTPPGKKAGPTPPTVAAPMRTNVKANKKGTC